MSAASFLVLPILLSVSTVLPNSTRETTTPGPFLLQHRDLIHDDTILVSTGNIIRAVNWYYKRTDVYLTNTHELGYGLGYPDAAGRLLNGKTFAALLAKNDRRHGVVLFCEETCEKRFTKSLPAGSLKYRYGAFILWYVPALNKNTDQGITGNGDVSP